MSKGTLLLVVRDHERIENLMAPWGWRLPVPEHWGEVVTEDEMEQFIEYCKAFMPDSGSAEEAMDFEGAYEEFGQSFEDETGQCFKKDDSGIWRQWVKYEMNPGGFWDEWSIEWERSMKEIGDPEELRHEFIIKDGSWLAIEGGVSKYVKDLPDETRLVSIVFRWA